MAIQYTSSDDFDTMLFGAPEQGCVDLIKDRLRDFGSRLTETARGTYDRAMETFERYNGAAALRRARELSRRAAHFVLQDVIRDMTSIADLQSAQPKMARWLAADPVLRRKMQRQECEGYAGTYIDLFPGDIGHTHHDYQKVMDGVFLEDDEDESTLNGPMFVQYFMEGDELEGDYPLDIDNVAIIVQAWKDQRRVLREGIHDTSSISGARLS